MSRKPPTAKNHATRQATRLQADMGSIPTCTWSYLARLAQTRCKTLMLSQLDAGNQSIGWQYKLVSTITARALPHRKSIMDTQRVLGMIEAYGFESLLPKHTSLPSTVLASQLVFHQVPFQRSRHRNLWMCVWLGVRVICTTMLTFVFRRHRCGMLGRRGMLSEYVHTTI